ncbi:cell death regulator Aven [Eucyclogobius newberryi]|uniref:cell death regulator Aven n=1 Tax=Eucyclogobius newberryi TaxID=166745 RepID=UPI003B5A3A78
MEGRGSRGRGGNGKRGDRSGHDGDSHSGEYRGRGRGAHHRGRGKRDHYRGRGRGGACGHAANFNRRDQDEGDFDGDDHVTQTFSRRKLESNWNRYEASETQEVDEDMPTQRGADYSVLLQSAGDSFTQFRFSDEKDWEMDSFVASQMSAFVDLSALAQSLQQVPLHHRLNLEAQLVQISTPMELPPQPLLKQDTSLTAPPLAVSKAPGPPHIVTAAPKAVMPPSPLKTAPSPAEGADEELDELLSLQNPEASQGKQSDLQQETSTTDKACEEVKDVLKEEKDKTEEEVRDEHVTATSVKKELTEEDLEDWLDSMIS